MELITIEKWQHTAEVEVFVDSSERKIIFKKFEFMYSFGLDDMLPNDYIHLGDFGSRYIAAVLNPTERFLLYQRALHDVVLLIQELLNLETKECYRVCGGEDKHILGFHWVRQGVVCDFVLVSMSGVDFYRLHESETRLLHVKSFQMSLGHYWLEPSEGVLVVAAAPPKLGIMQCFFLHQSKVKLLIGPKFSISVEPSVTNQWTETHGGSSHLQSNADPKNQQVALFKLYDQVYFIHVHCARGVGKLYRIGAEEVISLSLEMRIPVMDWCEIMMMDNMLLIVCPLRQETFVFDVKSEKGCFAVIHHGLVPTPPTISLKIEIDRNQKVYFPLITILYDKTDLSRAVAPQAAPFASHYIESELKLDPKMLFLDSDIMVDMRAGRCYKLMVDPRVLAEDHPDLLESVQFLLRRVGCKQAAYVCLREAIIRQVSFPGLSKLFFAVNKVYKQAAMERNYSEAKLPGFRKSLTPTSPSTPRKSSVFANEPELKINSGETVLLQADVLSLAFSPLAADTYMDLDYLSLVMMEYQRSLIVHDIQVLNSLQLLVAKVLVKTGNFHMLEMMTAGQVLSDSRELASMLLAISSPQAGGVYPPCFPLALDILKRLQLHDDLLDVFLSHHMIYEILSYLSSNPSASINWKRLAAAAEELGDEQLKWCVVRRMQE